MKCTVRKNVFIEDPLYRTKGISCPQQRFQEEDIIFHTYVPQFLCVLILMNGVKIVLNSSNIDITV